jgi:hypothetical protein
MENVSTVVTTADHISQRRHLDGLLTVFGFWDPDGTKFAEGDRLNDGLITDEEEEQPLTANPQYLPFYGLKDSTSFLPHAGGSVVKVSKLVSRLNFAHHWATTVLACAKYPGVQHLLVDSAINHGTGFISSGLHHMQHQSES